jgi:glycosyltransferase involved in cell wall biosynthesis
VVLHVAAVEFTAARLLRPQLAYLTDQGYDVRLACAPQGEDFSDDLRAFRPVRLAFPRSLDPMAMAKAALELRGLVKRMRPALVHFHSPAAALPGRAMLAIERHRPRVVYTVHGFLHTWDLQSRRDRAIARAERTLSRWTDALLFQSSEDYTQARAAGYRGRLVPLGNGVGDEWFRDRERRPRTGPLRVVFVGRLTREKGVGELVTAARDLPDVRWTIVGDALPSDRDGAVADVARLAADAGDRIRLVGMVSADRVRECLAEADLLVLPSWREGVPRSVIEGMASGLPVVATNIRGCRELVQPGLNGWLVPARDSTALGRAILQAAELDPDRLAAMGAAGRQRAWEHHREEGVFERISDTYRALDVAP